MNSEALFQTALAAQRFFLINDERDNLFHMADEAYKIYMSVGSDYNTGRFREMMTEYTKEFKRIASATTETVETFKKNGYNDLAEAAQLVQREADKNLLIYAELAIARQHAIDTECSGTALADIKRLESKFKIHQERLQKRKAEFKMEYDELNY